MRAVSREVTQIVALTDELLAGVSPQSALVGVPPSSNEVQVLAPQYAATVMPALAPVRLAEQELTRWQFLAANPSLLAVEMYKLAYLSDEATPTNPELHIARAAAAHEAALRERDGCIQAVSPCVQFSRARRASFQAASHPQFVADIKEMSLEGKLEVGGVCYLFTRENVVRSLSLQAAANEKLRLNFICAAVSGIVSSQRLGPRKRSASQLWAAHFPLYSGRLQPYANMGNYARLLAADPAKANV